MRANYYLVSCYSFCKYSVNIFGASLFLCNTFMEVADASRRKTDLCSRCSLAASAMLAQGENALATLPSASTVILHNRHGMLATETSRGLTICVGCCEHSWQVGFACLAWFRFQLMILKISPCASIEALQAMVSVLWHHYLKLFTCVAICLQQCFSNLSYVQVPL